MCHNITSANNHVHVDLRDLHIALIEKYIYFMNKVADLDDSIYRGWSCPELFEKME